MTPQQLIGMAFRLAALWLVLLCFQLYAILHALTHALQEEKGVLSLIAILTPLPLAIAFWTFPMLFAHKVLPPGADADGSAFSLQDSTAALSVLIGMFSVISALPILVNGLLVLLLAPYDSFTRVYFNSAGANHLAHLSQFGLGLGLILLARPLARRIFSSRATSSS
jgi:hypothetical protein